MYLWTQYVILKSPICFPYYISHNSAPEALAHRQRQRLREEGKNHIRIIKHKKSNYWNINAYNRSYERYTSAAATALIEYSWAGGTA